ncbi:MAG: ABC transporter ATP-binding protein [Desulfobacteraceae bacterium]|nr:ABC transporter ATP-binding protein [Desulfobacteraceae bacterium]
MSLLEIKGLRVSYGKALILDGIDMNVDQGELVGLIGPNGAGKTTLLRAISRVAPVEGSILFQGQRIDSLSPEKVVKLGIIHCPEGRHLFPDLTVLENIEIGAYLRKDRLEIEQDKTDVLEMFPVLEKREKQSAGTLSGGEQQMLAIARALMGSPSVLLLDEPSTGLALIVKDDISEKIMEIRGRGVTTLLVEQDTEMAFDLSDRIYVIEQGKIALEGPKEEIASNPYVKEIYLGMA